MRGSWQALRIDLKWALVNLIRVVNYHQLTAAVLKVFPLDHRQRPLGICGGDANSQPYLRPAESENQLRKIGNPPKVMQLVRGRAKMF